MKDNNRDNYKETEMAYGEESSNNGDVLKAKLEAAKKKSRLESITPSNIENTTEIKKNKKETNAAALENLGIKNRKIKEKANVYFDEETMNKLKTLSSIGDTSITKLIETIVKKHLKDVEVIDSEVRKYNKKNQNRKRK